MPVLSGVLGTGAQDVTQAAAEGEGRETQTLHISNKIPLHLTQLSTKSNELTRVRHYHHLSTCLRCSLPVCSPAKVVGCDVGLILTPVIRGPVVGLFVAVWPGDVTRNCRCKTESELQNSTLRFSDHIQTLFWFFLQSRTHLLAFLLQSLVVTRYISSVGVTWVIWVILGVFATPFALIWGILIWRTGILFYF